MNDDLISLFGIGLLIVMAWMFVFWIIQLFSRNAGVIDIGWALGLVILTQIYSIQAPGYMVRKLLILSMVVLWGIRLSALLISRILKDKKEDSRYQRLREDWKRLIQVKFFFLFQFQALLAAILSMPFLIICSNAKMEISLIERMGVLVWIMGFIGESLADEQLRRFKSDPQNKGKICQLGLWNYSRHPNYFFEWLMWVGYFVFALGSPYGCLGIISPIIMLHFLINVTGIPFAEAQSLRTRGEEYRQYQRTTSFFVPLPKKKI